MLKIHAPVVATLFFIGGAATAATVTLPDGSAVTYDPSAIGAGGSGVIGGTQQQAGSPAVPFSCNYDVVQNTVSGSGACGQILGALSLSALEGQIVAARVHAAGALQASSNARILGDLIGGRVGSELVLDAQIALQGGGGGPAFGDPTTGTAALAGGGFFNDDRLGLEKDGHNLVATLAVDRRSGNFIVGALAGYQNSDIDLTSLAGDLNSDGWLVGGYGTLVLGPVFSITASGTYADSSVDLRRTFGGAQVTSSFGRSEWSTGVTGNAFWRVSDGLGLSVFAGADIGGWDTDAYTDSRGIAFAKEDAEESWGRLGTVLTFFTGGNVRPYVNAVYGRLLSNMGYRSDRDTLTVGGGLTVIGSGRLSGGLGVNTLLLQSGQSETSVGLSLRLAL